METVFEYEIPFIHPLAVHFPLVLVLIGAAAVAVWLWRGTAFWRQAAAWLFVLGGAGALVAYFTGEALEEQMEGDPLVDQLVGYHEDAALYALLATLTTAAVLIGVSWWRGRWHPGSLNRVDALGLRIVVAVLAFAAALLIAWTAHIGGVMVWGRPV